jgi:hypothetical protein
LACRISTQCARALCVTVLAFCTPAFAQAPPSPDRVVYEAAFYSAFAPRTALDMINQTPGFVLNAPEEDERRGYSGAVGNVLIDGERLSAKSQSLRDVLGRVGANEVVRIEILRGSEVVGDASNAAVLANVVRTRASGSGTWELGPEVTNQRQPAPTARLGWSGRSDRTDYSIGFNMYRHDHDSPGVRSVTDASGVLLANRRGGFLHEAGEHALNGQVAFPAGVGRLVLTGQAAYNMYEEVWTLRSTTPAGAQIDNEIAPYEDEERAAEAGLTWQLPLGAWSLEVVALATRKQFESNVRATHFDAADVQDSEFVQFVDRDSGESIVRSTMTRPLEGGRLEFGGEVALNTLDGELSLTLDEGAGPAPVDVPNANLSVEENRGEAFVAHAMKLGANWSLDSRLAVETSRLSFTGDAEQSVSLTYVKPRVQLTRAFGRHQLQMRAFRDVGQLDFNDFVSQAQLADDIIAGGNPDLKPQAAWAAEAEGDLRFTENTALRVRLFKHFLEDVVDLVPVGPPGNQFDAPGNIGDGTMIGTEIALRLPIRFMPGGSLNVSGTWSDTKVHDPLTGERRQISDFSENDISATLRQDLNAAKLAWGLVFSGRSRDRDFRTDEIDSFRQIRQLNAFVETTVIDGFKIKLTAYNATSDTERRERVFFSPDRTGTVTQRELMHFRPGTWWLLTVSGSF